MHNLFWALLILFVAGVFFQMDWVYYLVYVLGGVWIFSHWWIRRVLRQLDVFRLMTDHAFLGEKPVVKLRFVNHSWLPLAWLQIQEQIPLDLKDASEYNKIVTIAGRSTFDHEYQLACKRRGYYSVGPLQLRTGDLFGFVTGARQENSAVALTVYPQVLPLEKLGLPSRSPFGTLSSRQRLFEDPARVAGVRSYSSGDSQRAIHWKASAREDELLVKKFQPAIALNVAIVLDLNRESYPYRGEIGFSEWAIVVAASLASHLISQRQAVGLISNGLDAVTEEPMPALGARTGQGHLMNMLSTLARAEMQRSPVTLADWLPNQLVGMEWGATIILVTPQITETTLWALHHAYRRGSNVIALVCAPQPNFDQMQAQSKKLGVKVEKTVWERDLVALQEMG
ncbi:MAG: DUF58 domain-containing protein [Caldilineaceae bacterium]|nr:DUF58 domain-containing protein [Caldilineaceae bacterium]